MLRKFVGSELVSDTIILSLGNVAQKIVLLLLMPLYTSLLTASEYGTVEIVISSVLILVPLATLNIHGAVFRFAIEDDGNREYLLKFSLGIILKATIIISIIAVILRLFNFEFYWTLIIILFSTYSLKFILADYVRAIGQVTLFAIAGICATLSLAMSNIIFFSIYKAGIEAYFVSIIISNLVNILILIFHSKDIWPCLLKSLSLKSVYNLRAGNAKKGKEYLHYSIPLIPNTISWWINSESSKYILIFFWGVSFAGLYTAALKIPSIINLFSMVFQQAWQYYASKEIENKDKLVLFRSIYRNFCGFMLIICTILILLSKPISSIILKNEFFSAWIYVPFLIYSATIAVVSVFFGGLFIAEKNTKGLMKTTVVGSAVSLFLSLLLIQFIGIGAIVIASIIGNIVILLIRISMCSKKLNFTFNQKILLISLAFLLIQCFCIVKGSMASKSFSVIIMIIVVLVNVVYALKMHKLVDYA